MLFADWQGLGQVHVWEADVSVERTDPQSVAGSEGRKEPTPAGPNAKRLRGKVGFGNTFFCNEIHSANFRSRGHIGTTEKFRNFSNTFTQRFQKKAPFFSWCWRLCWMSEEYCSSYHPEHLRGKNSDIINRIHHTAQWIQGTCSD